jgi:trimeric autotransporter adhesin
MSRYLSISINLLLLIVLLQPAVTLGLEKGSDTDWWRGFCPMGLNGPVSTATQWNSDLVVGGNFSEAGGLPAGCVARWSGDYWLPISTGLDAAPTTLFEYGDVLLAGGEFTQADGEPAINVAKYEDYQWGAMGDELRDEVHGFCTHNGALYAVGFFTLDESNPLSPYSAGAHWDGFHWILDNYTNWEWDSAIYAMRHFNANLYYGGQFAFYSAHHPGTWDTAYNIMRMDDEDAYQRLGDGMGGAVTELLPIGITLWIAGTFTSADGQACFGLASASSGHLLYPAAPLPYTASIREMIEYRDRPLVALSGGGDNRVLLYGDGSWQDDYPGNFQSELKCVASEGGRLYAGGSFNHGICVWDEDQWVHLGGGLGDPLNNFYNIRALLPYDGGLVAGGNFVLPGIVEGLYSQNLAFWNGEHWHYMDAVFNFDVYALAVHQTDLIAGGAFTTVNGDLLSHLASWDGDIWQDLGGVNGSVYALQGDFAGSLVVGGSFSSAGGVGAQRIAIWNGSYWSGMGAGFNATVRALAVHDGQLYAAGDFTLSGGTTLNHVARWNASLASWEALGSGLNGDVLSMVSFAGDLVVGGEFEQAGGADAAHIARWNGASWQPMADGFSGDATPLAVKSLCVADGRLLAGGNFTQAGGHIVNHVAEWAGDDSWHPLGTGVKTGYFQPEVTAMAPMDGAVYLGGHFGTAGNYPSVNMARWDAGPLVGNTLKSFSVDQDATSLTTRWETVTPTPDIEFRLEIHDGRQIRSIPYRALPGATLYHAEQPLLELMPGSMEVVLLSRGIGYAQWRTLASETVTLTAPRPVRLEGATPNPFNAGTVVVFNLAEAKIVSLTIYGLGGHLVKTLAAGPYGIGRHELPWDGRNDQGRMMASGNYLIKLDTGDRIETVKLQLLK